MSTRKRQSANPSKSKILLVANTGWYLYNFRLPLARRIRDEGLDVVLVSPRDSYVAHLEAEGFEFRELKHLSRRGMNPFAELRALWELLRLYRSERPRAVHHFTIKCVLYGTIAAKLSGVKSVVNADSADCSYSLAPEIEVLALSGASMNRGWGRLLSIPYQARQLTRLLKCFRDQPPRVVLAILSNRR